MPLPVAPVRVSELNFVPELFFDLIARIIPGYFVLGFAYLYIEIFLTLSTKPPYNFNDILSLIPLWFTSIIAYYLGIGFCIISRGDTENENIENIAKNLYKLTHNAPEDRGRFQKILAEFDSTSSIFTGLYYILILPILVLIKSFLLLCYIEKNDLNNTLILSWALLSILLLFGHIFFMRAMHLWKEKLPNILNSRLKDYEDYKKSLLREDWAIKFNDGSASGMNQASRFDIFSEKDNDDNYLLVISPYEINDYSCQVLVAPSTEERKPYPTRVECKLEKTVVINNTEIDKIKFALDKIFTIDRNKLNKQKLSQVILDDQQKILDILARYLS